MAWRVDHCNVTKPQRAWQHYDITCQIWGRPWLSMSVYHPGLSSWLMFNIKRTAACKIPFICITFALTCICIPPLCICNNTYNIFHKGVLACCSVLYARFYYVCIRCVIQSCEILLFQYIGKPQMMRWCTMNCTITWV